MQQVAGRIASTAATERWWFRIANLALVALVLTVLNAIQPLVVDDGVYYLNARHILSAPLDPYGGVLQIWGYELPRIAVLAPPVVPYWWAGTMALFGDSVLISKLVLFPFAVALALAVDDLARRFAPGFEAVVVVLIVLAPWVLPGFAFMLDIPALAIGLSALALFLRACDGGSIGVALLAGVLAGLAMQTKYNMATIPAVMLAYGFLAKRFMLALLAATAAGAVFVSWELLLWLKYGQSHFLGGALGSTGRTFSSSRLRPLLYGLIASAGPVGIALIPAACWASAMQSRRLIAVLVLCSVALLAICLGGDDWLVSALFNVPLERVPTLTTISGALGFALIGGLAFVTVQVWRRPGDPYGRFLTIWLLIELAAYFLMSPFPAVRRLLGLLTVGTLLVFHLAARRHLSEARWPQRAVAALGVMAGLGTWLIGYVDATNSRSLAREAAALSRVQAGDHRAWIWGFLAVEHHAREAGLAPITTGKTVLAKGDVLVVAPADQEKLYAWELSKLQSVGSPTVGTNLGVGLVGYFHGQRPFTAAADSRPRAILYRVLDDTVFRPVLRATEASTR